MTLTRRLHAVALGGLFLAAVWFGVVTVRPIRSGSVGPDSVAPVLEASRLLAGQALEGPLTQTSKPLLDLV